MALRLNERHRKFDCGKIGVCPIERMIRAFFSVFNTGCSMTTQDPLQSSGSPEIPAGFVDRRDPTRQRKSTGLERRQFSDGHSNLSPDAAELGRAVDRYKLETHRRFVTYEELLSVIQSLGYEKKSN